MPIFRASGPPSRAQRLFSSISAILIMIGLCALGLREAYSAVQAGDGHAPGAWYQTLFLIAIATCLCGFLLCIYWRTRAVGASLMAAAILGYLAFLGGTAWFSSRDQASWHQQDAHQNVNQRFSIVVYFRKGAPQAQVNDFIDSVLKVPGQPMHPAPEFPWFVIDYASLTPAQANGFEAVAVKLRDSAPSSATAPYLARIRADQRVDRVFLDIAPQSIHLAAGDAH
jgi:hypothetical protein